MRRIGITQRVEQNVHHAERRDCLDQSLTRLLWQIDCLPIPIANCVDDVPLLMDMLDVHGILLSGGNDIATLAGASNTAPERDSTEAQLLHFAAERDIPVFGICRGLQIMALHYGSTLSRITNHTGTRHPLAMRGGNRLRLSDRDSVNSFHNYGILPNQLGPDLIPLATAPDGTVEAIAHRSRQQAAIMWHPEREPADPQDRDMIREFFNP